MALQVGQQSLVVLDPGQPLDVVLRSRWVGLLYTGLKLHNGLRRRVGRSQHGVCSADDTLLLLLPEHDLLLRISQLLLLWQPRSLLGRPGLGMGRRLGVGRPLALSTDREISRGLSQFSFHENGTVPF